MNSLFYLIGRICISLMFIYQGVYDILHWGAKLDAFKAMELPIAPEHTTIALGVAVGLQLAGGAMVLLDSMPRLGALFLAIFLVSSFLFGVGLENMSLDYVAKNIPMIFQQLALLGGLFVLMGVEKRRTIG